MRFWALLVLLLVSSATTAEPLQVESRTLSWKPPKNEEIPMYASGWAEGSIEMPYVTGSPDIANRINDALYLSLTGTPAPLKPGKTFGLTDGASLDGIASMDFDVQRNDGRILSIEIDAEGCGAYCENYKQEFIFDARNGRAVAVNDLLTPQGLTAIGQRMLKERQRRYAAQIQELRKEESALRKEQKKGKKVDFSDVEERIAFNEDCLEREKTKLSAGSKSSRETIQYVRFALPAGKGMIFTSERCSAHVNRALDDVYEVELAIPPSEVADLLTPYGKTLLLGEGDAPAPVSPFGQILHGKIGPAAVTMLLYRPYGDGSFSGTYYYDKYRKPIPLRGMQKGKSVELQEEGSKGDTAKFILAPAGTGFTGQWQGRAKELPVTLKW